MRNKKMERLLKYCARIVFYPEKKRSKVNSKDINLDN